MRRVPTLHLIDFATIVFYEVDYSLTTMWQALSRLWRPGQEQAVEVYYPICASAMGQEASVGGSILDELAMRIVRGEEIQGGIASLVGQAVEGQATSVDEWERLQAQQDEDEAQDELPAQPVALSDEQAAELVARWVMEREPKTASMILTLLMVDDPSSREVAQQIQDAFDLTPDRMPRIALEALKLALLHADAGGEVEAELIAKAQAGVETATDSDDEDGQLAMNLERQAGEHAAAAPAQPSIAPTEQPAPASEPEPEATPDADEETEIVPDLAMAVAPDQQAETATAPVEQVQPGAVQAPAANESDEEATSPAVDADEAMPKQTGETDPDLPPVLSLDQNIALIWRTLRNSSPSDPEARLHCLLQLWRRRKVFGETLRAVNWQGPSSARIDWGVTHKLALWTVRNELEGVIHHRERKTQRRRSLELRKRTRNLDMQGWQQLAHSVEFRKEAARRKEAAKLKRKRQRELVVDLQMGLFAELVEATAG